jgi:hypothetical protein
MSQAVSGGARDAGRKSIAGVAILLLCATSATAAKQDRRAKPPAKPTIALLPLGGIVPAAERGALDAELRAGLPDMGFVVQASAKTTSVLADVKALGLACDTGSIDCLVRVGALGGANVVLAGVVSPDERGASSLELLAVDVNGLRERGRIRVLIPDEGAGRRSAIVGVLTGVLRPEAWRGLLRVNVAQRGASIVIDGVPRGFAPLSAAIELTPGPHALFVGLEGFRPHKERAEVVYDDEVTIDVALVPGASEQAPVFSTAPKPEVAPVPAPTPAPIRKGPLRVAMYDVEATGVAPRVAQVMGTFLVAELRKREAVSVLDSGELRVLVGGGATTAGDVRSCREDQCFAEVAEALGADSVVVAQLTQVEGEVLFGLRRIDQHKQELTASFLQRVPAGDTEALLPLVGQSITAAFADRPLRAGEVAGVDERAQRVMNPPPLPPLLAGSLYAGTAIASVAGTALLGVSLVSWFEYNDAMARFAPRDTDGDENAKLQPLRDRFAGSQLTGFIVLGAAAALGASALLTSRSTDWQGYGAEMKSEAPTERRAP